MAVYKRSYRSYTGRLTPPWSRFFVLTRYALRGMFRSKFLTTIFVLSFFSPLICAILIYLNHNAAILNMVHSRHNEAINVNGDFFLGFLGVQGAIAFFLTAFIGPNTIAPDLANGALPLYFCRRHGTLRLGEMADRSGRAHPGRHVFAIRLRRRHQRCDAIQHRILHRSWPAHHPRLRPAFRSGCADRHPGCGRLDRFARHVRHLPGAIGKESTRL
jgi:hypothetical protein